MKKIILTSSICIVLLLTYTNNLFALIKATSVKGRVAYKAGARWQTLRNGTELQQGTIISTGIRSEAVLIINNNTLTVRQLTIMKIHHNSSSNKISRTRVALRRGSLRAQIKKGMRIKTVFKVSTPVATSSVRGTIEDVSYGPTQGMIIKVIEGIVLGEDRNGSRREIKGKQEFIQKVIKSLPENILADLKEKAISSLFDQNMTEDERLSFDTNNDNIIDDNQSTIGSIDQDTRQDRVRPEIDLTVQWP